MIDFGEICLWSGVFLSALNGFNQSGQWICLLSPIFVAFLLTQMSGIPILEKSAQKRWGEDPAYQTYKKNTPVLIPFIGPK